MMTLPLFEHDETPRACEIFQRLHHLQDEMGWRTTVQGYQH